MCNRQMSCTHSHTDMNTCNHVVVNTTPTIVEIEAMAQWTFF